MVGACTKEKWQSHSKIRMAKEVTTLLQQGSTTWPCGREDMLSANKLFNSILAKTNDD